MAITRTHDLHRRRLGRNIGLGLVLAALVGMFFALTIVKVSNQTYLPAGASTSGASASGAATSGTAHSTGAGH